MHFLIEPLVVLVGEFVTRLWDCLKTSPWTCARARCVRLLCDILVRNHVVFSPKSGHRCLCWGTRASLMRRSASFGFACGWSSAQLFAALCGPSKGESQSSANKLRESTFTDCWFSPATMTTCSLFSYRLGEIWALVLLQSNLLLDKTRTAGSVVLQNSYSEERFQFILSCFFHFISCIYWE